MLRILINPNGTERLQMCIKPSKIEVKSGQSLNDAMRERWVDVPIYRHYHTEPSGEVVLHEPEKKLQ